MCHGTREDGDFPLSASHFDKLIAVARELGFESINYDQLHDWMAGKADIPDRTIMFDFDHPVKSIITDVHPILDKYGYRGTLFVNTGPMSPGYKGKPSGCEHCMTWDEINQLAGDGWHLGAHTVTHPNLSDLFVQDPTGEKIRQELEECDATILKHTGKKMIDFAFTATTWSSGAEAEVKRRYRFGRLWIIGSEYQVDGKVVRYADLAGVPGEDEADGGPPMAARYITKQSHRYRLPSVEFQSKLMNKVEQFRRYLEGSFDGAGA